MAWYKLDEDGEIEGLNGGGGAPPVVNYVARPDGVSQYWQLTTPINLDSGDTVELSFIGGQVSNAFAMFIESDSKNFYVSVTSDSISFRVKAAFGSPMLNGTEITNSVTAVPLNGGNIVSVDTVGPEVLSVLAGRVGGSLLMNLPIYNFRVIRNGAVINEILLTNKEQGATQLAIVGAVNAFMPNYTPDVWEVNPNAS